MTGRSKYADGPSSFGPAGGSFHRSLKAIRRERAEQQEIKAQAAAIRIKHDVLLPYLDAERRRLEEKGYSPEQIVKHPSFRKVLGKSRKA